MHFTSPNNKLEFEWSKQILVVNLRVFSPFLQRGVILSLFVCLLLKERICSLRSKIFSLRVDLNQEGWQNEIDRVASPENVPNYL